MSNKIGEKKHHKTDFLLIALLVIALCVSAFAGKNLFSIFSEYKAGSDEYAKIKEMVVEERSPEENTQSDRVGYIETAKWEAPISVDFEQLRAINEDVVGWLYVEALPSICYPIVKGEDNEYYLHRTYEKKDVFAGSIFIDYKNNGDFGDCNTIVYGHNMKDGSMFGTLKKFKDAETINISRYIWVLTPQESFKYEIFSAYTAQVESETYTLIKGPGEELQEYASHMLQNSDYAFGEREFQKTDKILTLSTCTGNESTRYVVQAVQIDP